MGVAGSGGRGRRPQSLTKTGVLKASVGRDLPECGVHSWKQGQ